MLGEDCVDELRSDLRENLDRALQLPRERQKGFVDLVGQEGNAPESEKIEPKVDTETLMEVVAKIHKSRMPSIVQSLVIVLALFLPLVKMIESVSQAN